MDYKDLNLIGSSSPHIRTKDGTGRIMGEVLLALIPAMLFGIYNFGWRALSAALVSAAGCCFFEWAYRKLMKKLVPWYFGPMREKMMRLLLTILTDG